MNTKKTVRAALVFAVLALGLAAVRVDAAVQSMVHWEFDGAQDQANFGHSVATAGDLNGDGYSDVIVGEPYADRPFSGTNNGRVRVFFGGPAGVDETAEWSGYGASSSLFGWSISAAGDVNGDGYGDVIMGSPSYDNGGGGEGAVYVYYGSPGGLVLGWSKYGTQSLANLGYCVSTAGDLNGDGYDDVLFSAHNYTNTQTNQGRIYIHLGGPNGLAESPVRTLDGIHSGDKLGFAVAAAGDVNADGYDDVLVSAPYYEGGTANQGIVYCLHGSAGGIDGSPDWSELGSQVDEYFGNALTMAGDVNGDGYTDVIIGGGNYDGDHVNEGHALVYLGGSAGLAAAPVRAYESYQTNGYMGASVGTAGDLNGDGYADIIVAAPRFDFNYTDEGWVQVYQGTPNGPAFDYAAWLYGGAATSGLGWSVQTAGDVNGDGCSDLIMGAPFHNNGRGRARIYLGSADDYTMLPSFTAQANQVNALMSSIGFADVNGDGYSDLLAGAPYYDAGQTNEGRAYCWLGGRDGLAGQPFWSQDGNSTNAYFGHVAASAGDVNGDGYDDVIMTASGLSQPEQGEGGAWVYHGSPSGISNPTWTGQGQEEFAKYGYSAGSAGDVNGDGYGDIVIGGHGHDNPQVDEGMALIYLGSADGLADVPVIGWEGNQAGAKAGFSVACAGDVNGDGFSDVISGAPGFDDRQIHEGCVFVFFGATELSPSYSQILTRDRAGAQFGVAVAPAGDVNGDGYSDIVVGANRWSNGQDDEGSIAVYLGSPAGLSTAPVFTYESNTADALLGEWVAPVGDVNADGYSDFAAAAPTYGSDEGRVYIFAGSPSGVNATPITILVGWNDGERFGSQLAGRGDVDGDGFPDLAIAAPYFSEPESSEGLIRVYQGNRYWDEYFYGAGLDRKLQMRKVSDLGPVALLGRSDSGIEFRFRAFGRTPFGRGRIRAAWEIQPLGTTWTGNIARSEFWLQTAPPDPSHGSYTSVNQEVDGLSGDTAYHWRVRFEGESPYFPRSPWLSIVGNGPTEADFRTAGTPSAVTNSGLPGEDHRITIEEVTPNPIRNAATIRFRQSEAGLVTLTLHDVSGRRVRSLMESLMNAGSHAVAWDGCGENGRSLVAGVYFVRLEAQNHVVHARVIVSR